MGRDRILVCFKYGKCKNRLFDIGSLRKAFPDIVECYLEEECVVDRNGRKLEGVVLRIYSERS